MRGFLAVTLFLASLVLPSLAAAVPVPSGFTDPSDGMFDVSDWLAERKGFFPVPVLITEPAVGYGGGLALVFLHDPLAGRVAEGETFDPQAKGADGRLVPPSISAVFGAYTRNGTWLAGGGHLGIWKNDTIRYNGGVLVGSINMDFYGLGADKDTAVAFNLQTTALFQGLKFRLGKSAFFAGADYLYLATDVGFDAAQIVPGPRPGIIRRNRDASLILSLRYEGRDNIFTPSRGLDAAIGASLFREAIGSDSEFERYRARLRWFTPLGRRLVLGLRGDYEVAAGTLLDIPFYQYPFVSLRGIPVMRYQGKGVAVGEAELRWNVTPRWSVVFFGGVGSVAEIVASEEGKGRIISRGAGFRYFIARRFGLHAGVDVARGPEETAIYLQVGHAWRF